MSPYFAFVWSYDHAEGAEKTDYCVKVPNIRNANLNRQDGYRVSCFYKEKLSSAFSASLRQKLL